VIEPILIELIEATYYEGSGSAADGAGGSGEARSIATNVIGVRSDAHHGYNGYGTASATLAATLDGAGHLAELADSVVGFHVAIDWSARASGVLKHPWDRTASFRLFTVVERHDGDGRFVDEDVQSHVDEYREGNDDKPFSEPRFDGGGTITTTLTPDTPTLEFSLTGTCSSSSGPMAFALLNEGYCDFVEQGSIELTGLTATLTPILETTD
jgi:hypothetical protein